MSSYSIYYMFLEFLGAFFSLNFAWIIHFIMGNLFWLFVIAAAVCIFYPSDKHLWGFIFFIFFLWIFSDVNGYMGWTINNQFAPIYFALVAVPAFVFLEKDGKLSKYNLPLQVIAMVLIWAFLTFG